MSSFGPAFRVLMRLEGKYSNEKNDAGGETFCGITKPRFNLWVRKYGGSGDWPNLTADEVRRCWRDTLWNVEKFGEWIQDQELANTMFQFSALSGVNQAAKELQRAINTVLPKHEWLKIDGWAGPKTQSVIDYARVQILRAHFLGFIRLITHTPTPQRVDQYKKNKVFLQGWTKRTLTGEY